MKITRKVGIVISVQMGLIMGAVFTFISMLKTGNIVPVGIIISALISSIISGVWGGIISVKNLSDKAAIKLSINPAKQKMKYNIVEAIIGDICFTPILCTFFIIKNVGIHNPMFFKILFTNMLIDFIICFFLNLIFCPIFKKIASKLFKIDAIN